MLNCCTNSCFPSCSDWIIFGLGVFVTIAWAMLIYCLRPKLLIETPVYSENETKIKTPIRNNSIWRKATRIVVELAVVSGSKTNHLKTKINDFAFLPSRCSLDDSMRVFKSGIRDDGIQNLNNHGYYLRVRVHATDSFSGLGKTFQEKYIAVDGDFRKNGFKKI